MQAQNLRTNIRKKYRALLSGMLKPNKLWWTYPAWYITLHPFASTDEIFKMAKEIKHEDTFSHLEYLIGGYDLYGGQQDLFMAKFAYLLSFDQTVKTGSFEHREMLRFIRCGIAPVEKCIIEHFKHPANGVRGLISDLITYETYNFSIKCAQTIVDHGYDLNDGQYRDTKLLQYTILFGIPELVDMILYSKSPAYDTSLKVHVINCYMGDGKTFACFGALKKWLDAGLPISNIDGTEDLKYAVLINYINLKSNASKFLVASTDDERIQLMNTIDLNTNSTIATWVECNELGFELPVLYPDLVIDVSAYMMSQQAKTV